MSELQVEIVDEDEMKKQEKPNQDNSASLLNSTYSTTTANLNVDSMMIKPSMRRPKRSVAPKKKVFVDEDDSPKNQAPVIAKVPTF